jgi:FkbH-like protein
MTRAADARRLRERIEEEIGAGRFALARQHLAALWERDPGMATAGYLVRSGERLRGGAPLLPYSVAILRSFTVEPLVPLLRAGALAGGIDLDVQLGGFNAYRQEILDPESAFHRARPSMAILAVQADDLGLALADAPSMFREIVTAFRARSDAPLVIHDLAVPVAGGDAEGPVRRANEELGRLAQEYPGVFVLPFAELARAQPASGERNQAAMRMPLANEALLPLVRRWLSFIHPLSGRICKALVTDLDNTLWAGVLGEDGLDGIACGPDGRGARHHALQQALLSLHERGILLAIASKNDEPEAREALERHPGFLLRPAHFAATRIDWRDKPGNLRQIAAELNIGVDALAYLDDDPVELERMRSELPEVTVLELPPESDREAAAVRDHPVFARTVLSDEDRARQRYYAEQRARTSGRDAAPSLDAFYRSLEQEVSVDRMTAATADRAAQLTQKTNQFNLTTRRYGTPELLRMASDPGVSVFTVRVTDCYGDNGLTGLAIVRDTHERSEIDTFLLSCRVLGRGVEDALLAFLRDRARAQGLREIRARYVATAKNGQVAGFLPTHGFEPAPGEEGAWVADPKRLRVECPEWIRMTATEGALA